MCGAAYTPAEVTEKPKYMGSRQQGKRLTLEGGADGDRAQGGIPMQRKLRLVLTSGGILEFLYYAPLGGCVSSTFALLAHMKHPMEGDNHTKFCLIKSSIKRANILRFDLRDNTNSRCFCFMCMGGGENKRFN